MWMDPTWRDSTLVGIITLGLIETDTTCADSMPADTTANTETNMAQTRIALHCSRFQVV
jgi:hypothetical protein